MFLLLFLNYCFCSFVVVPVVIAIIQSLNQIGPVIAEIYLLTGEDCSTCTAVRSGGCGGGVCVIKKSGF